MYVLKSRSSFRTMREAIRGEARTLIFPPIIHIIILQLRNYLTAVQRTRTRVSSQNFFASRGTENGRGVQGGWGRNFPAGENANTLESRRFPPSPRALTFMDMLNRCRAYIPINHPFGPAEVHRTSRRRRASVRAHDHRPSVQREARPATEREPLTRPVLKHRAPAHVRVFRPYAYARDGR